MDDYGRGSGVQSVAKALGVLEIMGDAGGELSLSEIAATAELQMPTIHRLVRTLLDRGYVRQLPNRRYTLGPRLIPLGYVAGTIFGTWSQPELTRIVDALGETVNLAVLDHDHVLYVGQVPSPHSMRTFNEVGRRVSPHCTGVGKALLSRLTDDEALALLQRTGMPVRTPATITSPEAMITVLQDVRDRGYARDDGEMELGVRCIAVSIPDPSARMAVSMSGPATRMSEELLEQAVPMLIGVSERLATEIGHVRTG